MTRRRNSSALTAIVFALATLAAALPAAANGHDDLAYVSALVRKLYLEPLGVSDALLEVKTEYFAAGQRPAAFTVRAGQRGPGHEEFEELLEVGVIVVDGKLMFISASGPLVDRARPLARDAREVRISGAIRYLESISAWRATAVRKPGRKKGAEEIVFDDPTDFPWLSKGPRTVVFDTNGLLILAGAPLLPAPESR